MKTPSGIVWCPHCSKPHRLTERICPTTGKSLERDLHKADDTHPLIGTVIDGKYRVLRVIGRGGAGTVFEGENVALRRLVAIKMIPHANETSEMRFEREVRIVSSLQHPNIWDVYDVGSLPIYGNYIVGERLHGETVASRLRWKQALPVAEVVDIAAQVLSGLHAAHAQSVVHRDVKPQNVYLVDRLGCAPVAKLLDFGLAKELLADTRLTRPGKAIGTPYYMSPEQLGGREVTPQTDLFAVGLLMYEMLTAVHPFHGPTLVDLQSNILRAKPHPPSVHARHLSPELDALVLHALSKRPEDRPASAHAMQRDLLRCPTSVSAPPSSRSSWGR